MSHIKPENDARSRSRTTAGSETIEALQVQRERNPSFLQDVGHKKKPTTWESSGTRTYSLLGRLMRLLREPLRYVYASLTSSFSLGCGGANGGIWEKGWATTWYGSLCGALAQLRTSGVVERKLVISIWLEQSSFKQAGLCCSCTLYGQTFKTEIIQVADMCWKRSKQSNIWRGW